jgi:RHH-type proline utilization regulon transcriptional repressor/proline dehydrogenase/delta 1-pyrroline-5-carboxylate dehydrogenase
MHRQDWTDIPDFSQAELAAIESRTREIGHHLFQHLDEDRPSVFQRRWWDDQLMQLTMRDEALKVQLFRFVDVLPMLGTSEAVVEHLQEYLNEVRGRLPGAVRAALGIGRHTLLTRTAIARLARLSAMDLARRFIAGTNIREVVDSARRERELQRAFTLDILGEAVISRDESEKFFRAYVDLIENVAPEVNQWPASPRIDDSPEGPLPRMNLSIKLSALDRRFDPIDPAGSLDRAGSRLRELLRISRRNRAFLNVDMESYSKKDLTLAIFQSVLEEPEFRDFTDVGVVIQCYLRDSPRDLVRLVDWAQRRGAPVWVRLVKGAYWDFETVHAGAEGWPIPVYQQKWESDAAFERATRFVMRQRQHLRPALGSHNIRSLAHGIATAEHLNLPANAFELQMLYGMADGEKQSLVRLGHRLRIYMPYGELIPGMAYLVRRLLENTSNNSFVRAGFVENVAIDKLLAPPAPFSAETGPQPPPSVRPSQAGPAGNLPGQPRSPIMSTDLSPFRNEPQIDFALEKNRQAMREALQQVLGQIGADYPLVIGGLHLETGERIRSLDPSYHQRLIGTVCTANREQANQAVAAARAAFPAWRDRGAAQRAGYLRRIAQELRQRLFELAAWEVYECGKGWREATSDICESIDFCEYYALGAEAMERPRGADVPGEENRFEYVPRGVTAVIAPWNFPLAILTGMTAAALATGNTVVMKPSEQSSVVAALLMNIAEQVELPPGVLNYLPGRGEVVGAALVEHPEVAVIAFTGSRTVGMAIHVQAAEVSARGLGYVKRVIAEMGGKNGIIVDRDADLDEAVLGVIQSAFGYQGQKCSACSRAIVLAEVYDLFLQRRRVVCQDSRVHCRRTPGGPRGPGGQRRAIGRTGLLRRPTHIRGCAPARSDRPGGDLRARPGRDSCRRSGRGAADRQ